MSNSQEYYVTNADKQAAYNNTQSDVQKQIDAQPKYEPSIQVGKGGYTTGGPQHVPTTVHASDINSGHGGVLGTARSFMGGPTTNVRDHTQVTLPNGMDTSAAAAATLGFLVKQPDGSYRNADDKESERF